MKKIEMIGKNFGDLKVIEERLRNKNGHIKYLCECVCGNKTEVFGTHLRRGNSTSCGCKNKINKNGGITGDLWYNITSHKTSKRASRKNLEFGLTKEYIYNLFIEQNSKCALSGIVITLPKRWDDKSYTASLDRIDSKKGYVIGNVQWLHKHINVMKNIFEQDMFIFLCNQISNNHKICDFDIEKIDKFKWGLNTKHYENNLG
jgi:hypothetical protein